MNEEKHYAFYQNTACEYFPCHRMERLEDFNCLFCYCPLYALGKQCKGRFTYKGDIKVCTDCTIPHRRENYDYIIGRYKEIVEIVKLADQREEKAKMKSLLIKDTTREERAEIVAESIGNIDSLCDGCSPGLAEMYNDYIDGKKELREINMEFNTRYTKAMIGPDRGSECGYAR